MPRVYSPEMLEEEALDEAFEDEDADPFLAAPHAFQYLPPPAFGGPEGPVRVAVRPSQVGRIVNQPSMFDRIWSQHSDDGGQAEWQVRMAEQKAREEGIAATLAAYMAELGAVRAYVRYDGGNDEGFAWLDHCVFRDGSVRDARRMVKDLAATSLAQALDALGENGALRDLLDYGVAVTWACELLGEGFGTGEYVMYGAFSVDLETGLVTDDPNPAPVAKNISLKAE